jgi:large subunit ribosomal protein L6
MVIVAKKKILIPKAITIEIINQTNEVILAIGNKITRKRFLPIVQIILENDYLSVIVLTNDQFAKSYQGSIHSLLNSTIIGITKGFSKVLILEGIGYYVEINNDTLLIRVNCSYLIKIYIPHELTVIANSSTKLTISGFQKDKVTSYASRIRALCPPEPYKGKGIRYATEIIKIKTGKKLRR